MRHRYLAIAASTLIVVLSRCHSHTDQASPHANTADGGIAPITSVSTTVGSSPAPDAAAPKDRRFALHEGRTAVVGAEDRVVILGADGGSESESYCGANGISYDRAVAFFTQVQRLIATADKTALAELVSFPLHASTPIANRKQFLALYDKLFTPIELAAIAHADPGEIFCRNGAFMLGDGELWATPNDLGDYRVTTVNPPIPHAATNVKHH